MEHPGLLTADHMEILDGQLRSRPLRQVFGYQAGWELPSDADVAEVVRVMAAAR